jgi:hypothetical protein
VLSTTIKLTTPLKKSVTGVGLGAACGLATFVAVDLLVAGVGRAGHRRRVHGHRLVALDTEGPVVTGQTAISGWAMLDLHGPG